MKFSEQIDPEHLLHALNRKRDYGSERLRETQGPNRAVQMPDGSWSGLRAAPDEDYSQASQILITELRGLVDQWLASGRVDGIEEPKMRSLEKALPAFRAMNSWALQHKPMVIPTITGELMVAGGWSETRLSGQDDPKVDALNEARRQFVLLMNSPLKYRIFQCGKPGCGEYYTLDKPRQTYKRQTYCSKHRRQVSALRGTKEARERGRNAALQIAVDAFREWPALEEQTRTDHGTIKRYIEYKLGKKSGFSVKWVTRNLPEIENRAKKQK